MRRARTAGHGGARRLATCLPDNLQKALSTRVDEDSRLRQAWVSCVPEPLGTHVHPVRFVAGLLFLHVNTSAWASRLRYEKPALLELLRKSPAFKGIGDIRYRVVPVTRPPRPEPAARPASSRLSATAAEVVAQSAVAIADPALRAALERLARAGQQSCLPKRRP